MPRLGWASEEGTLIEWLKQDGDPSGAATSSASSRATRPRWRWSPSTRACCGFPPPRRRPAPSSPPWAPCSATSSHPVKRSPPPGPVRAAAPAGGAATRDTVVAVTADARAARGAGPTASPRARRVAAELRVNWSMKGSGRTGRIVERDVRAAGQLQPAERRAPADRRADERERPDDRSGDADDRRRCHRAGPPPHHCRGRGGGRRRRASVVHRLLRQARRRRPRRAPRAERLAGRRAHHPARGHPRRRGRRHDAGTPHLRAARRGGKVAPTLATESAALIAQARAGAVSPDALRGGTFTVSNLGAYEIVS